LVAPGAWLAGSALEAPTQLEDPRFSDRFFGTAPLPPRNDAGVYEDRCSSPYPAGLFGILASLPDPDHRNLWCALGPGYLRYDLTVSSAVPDAPGTLGRALLAWVALSYGTHSAADSRRVAGEYGFDLLGIRKEDTCVLIGQSQDTIVLGFRGTPTPGAALRTNVGGTLKPQMPDVAGLVHTGFRFYLDVLYDDLVRFLASELRGRRLLLTGHSLGASAATLLAARLAGGYRFGELGVPSGTDLRPFATYTYGGPRTGDPVFAQFVFDSCNVFRYVNLGDPVVELVVEDFGPLGQYRHSGTPRCIPLAVGAYPPPCPGGFGDGANPVCWAPHTPYAYFKDLDLALQQGLSLDAADNPGFPGLDDPTYDPTAM
jgi:hypothetical protein